MLGFFFLPLLLGLLLWGLFSPRLLFLRALATSVYYSGPSRHLWRPFFVVGNLGISFAVDTNRFSPKCLVAAGRFFMKPFSFFRPFGSFSPFRGPPLAYTTQTFEVLFFTSCITCSARGGFCFTPMHQVWPEPLLSAEVFTPLFFFLLVVILVSDLLRFVLSALRGVLFLFLKSVLVFPCILFAAGLSLPPSVFIAPPAISGASYFSPRSRFYRFPFSSRPFPFRWTGLTVLRSYSLVSPFRRCR